MALGFVGSSNQRRQFPGADSDEVPLVNFGPDGEVQVFNNDVPPVPAGIYPTTGDVNQIETLTQTLATNGPATGISPTVAYSAIDPFYTGETPITQSNDGDFSTILDPTLSATQNDATSSAISLTILPSSESTRIDSSADPSRVSLSAGTTVLSASTTVAISSTTLLSSPISVISITSFSSFSVSVETSVSSSSFSSSELVSSSPVSSSTLSFVSSTSFVSSHSIVASTSANSSSAQSSASSIPFPLKTVTAPPNLGNQANLNVHDPPYYVGIVLGTFVGIALLVALIAWFIRFQSRAARRRRAKGTIVPWARFDKDTIDAGGLEAGHGYGVDGYGAAALNLGSREELAHMETWMSRGDRDVGEPRRAEDSYFGTSAHGLQQHSIPSSYLFSEETIGALTGQKVGTSLARPRHPSRCLPSHLIDERAAAQGQTLVVVNGVPASLNPSYCPSEDCNGKSYFGHDHGGSSGYTWDQQFGGPTQKQTIAERLRNHGNKPKEAASTTQPWDGIGPLPTPGGHINENSGQDEHPWAHTLKTSLANAFSSVAANLTLNSGASKVPDDDKLTAPPRRNTRKSLRDVGMSLDEKSSVKSLSRGSSVSSSTSKAWTLEETGEGAGIVHLLKTDANSARRPMMTEPNLSFGDGESISTYSDQASDSHTLQNKIPLVASSKPQQVYIRAFAREHLGRRISSETFRGSRNPVSVSRNSSVYSTASMPRGRSITARYASTGLPSVVSEGQITQPVGRHFEARDEDECVVIRPDAISRSNSMDLSDIASKQPIVDASPTARRGPDDTG